MRDDELDLLINDSLTTYGEPRSGLETRILSRVTAAREAATHRPNHRWLVWVLAVPVAACVILLFTIPNRRQAHPNVAPRTYEQDHHPIAKVQSAPPEILSVPPRRRSSNPHPMSVSTTARTDSAPKLDVFPSPQPLGDQENALVALASRTDSPETQQALTEAKEQSEKPLEISAIHIPPITTPDEGSN
jgi:hypothetical protein